MTKIKAERRLECAADAAWQAVGDFSNADWVPGMVKTETEGEGVGAVRRLHTEQGGVIVERLEAIDERQRAFTYTITEAPMPLENYHGTVAVTGDDEGCTVSWRASFDTAPEAQDDIEQALQGLFDAALDGLVSRFG